MADIRVSGAPVIPSLKDEESIRNRNLARVRRLEQRESAAEASNAFEERVTADEKVDIQRFQDDVAAVADDNAQQSKGASLQHARARAEIPPSMLELYAKAGASLDAQETLLQDADVMKYLAGEEVEQLLSELDPKNEKKAKFEELSNKLESAQEGTEDSLIDSYARTACSSKADIYLMLCYISESLSARKARQRLLDRLKQIIDAFERQESGYLFEFFSMQNMPGATGKSPVNATFMDKMANLASGHVQIDSLKQTFQFVCQILPEGELFKMVSLFMKVRAKQLKKMQSAYLSREDKEEMIKLLKEERNLIMLNSLYNNCKRMVSKLKKTTEVQEKYVDLLNHIISVLETSLVSGDGIQNMGRGIGIKPGANDAQGTFIRYFATIIEKAPIQLFQSDAARVKVIEALNKLKIASDAQNKPNSTPGLSFLHKRPERVRNV